jgi:hypothetical protein
MTDARQIQLQLFGRPSRLAGLWTLESGRSANSLAGPIASSALAYSVDVVQPGNINSDLLKNQSSDRQILSVGHIQPPSDEVQQNTSESQGAGETHRELGKSFQGQSYLNA